MTGRGVLGKLGPLLLVVGMFCAVVAPATAGEDRFVIDGIEADSYVSGLDFPVDMVHARGTRKIFFTEKASGKVRVLRGTTLLAKPCVNLKVESDREQGAAGIALHPDFATNHYLYVYFMSSVYDDNRVVRFTVEKNRCTDGTVIIKKIPQAPIHNGGQIEFLDGYLFVSTGDAMNPSEAQDPYGLSGKILRLNPDGSIPDGNPFSLAGFDNNPVWSLGHRNPFGLAARAETSHLFESENGPTCDDEVNLIVEGENYGWGTGEAGMRRKAYERAYCDAPPAQREPLWEWGEGDDPTIAPTDLVWYRGALEMADDRLLMGDFKEGKLRAFEVALNGEPVSETVLVDDLMPIIDVARGPGGWVYYSTIDSIIRLRPSESP